MRPLNQGQQAIIRYQQLPQEDYLLASYEIYLGSFSLINTCQELSQGEMHPFDRTVVDNRPAVELLRPFTEELRKWQVQKSIVISNINE